MKTFNRDLMSQDGHGTGPRKHESFTLAAWLIENEMSPPGWAEAFQQVKFDTADNPEWKGERYVVIVAKGDHADRLVEVYDHD